MKKGILLFIFILIIISTSYASPVDSLKNKLEWTAKNAVFYELGGIGGGDALINFNYDRIFYVEDWFKTSLRIGGSFPLRNTAYFNSFPIMLNLIFGRRSSFEFGFGGVLLFEDLDYKTMFHAISVGLGYRYQRPKGGFFGRIGITPTIGYFGQYLWMGGLAGISIGYSFGCNHKVIIIK